MRFISEYLVDQNATQACLRAGIPETYAARQGQWLKKHPMVIAALERDIDAQDLRKLQREITEIESRIDNCKQILGLDLPEDLPENLD